MTSQVYAPLLTPLIILLLYLLIVIKTYMLIHDIDKLQQICGCYIFLLSQIVASTLLSFFFFSIFYLLQHCFLIIRWFEPDGTFTCSKCKGERKDRRGGGVRCGIYVVFLTREEKKKKTINCSYTWINHLVICVIQNFTYDLLINIFLTKQTSSTTYVNSNILVNRSS